MHIRPSLIKPNQTRSFSPLRDSWDYLIYDFEALGLKTQTDQPIQVGMVNLDNNLVRISEMDLNIKRNEYSVPSPAAMDVTNIWPNDFLNTSRISEFEAAIQVSNTFQSRIKGHKRLFAGYNNMKYDEKLLRHFLFRNLQAPYVTSQAGSARLDLYSSCKYLSYVHPGLIRPGRSENGDESWKLGDVVSENGIIQRKLHCGLSDANMTADLLILFKSLAPRVFDDYVQLSDKKSAEKLVSGALRKKDFVFLFTHFGKPEVHVLSPIAYLKGSRRFLAVDVSVDASSWSDLSSEEIAEAVLDPLSPFRILSVNDCSPIFDRGNPTLNSALQRDGILQDSVEMENRSAALRTPELMKKLNDAGDLIDKEGRARFGGAKPATEMALYDGGFIPDSDRDLCREISKCDDWEKRILLVSRLADRRLRDFAHRLIAMHAPVELRTAESLAILKFNFDLRLRNDDEACGSVTTFKTAYEDLERVSDEIQRSEYRSMLDTLEAFMLRKSSRISEQLENMKFSEGLAVSP